MNRCRAFLRLRRALARAAWLAGATPVVAAFSPAMPPLDPQAFSASGVFINAQGDVLTARHAVEHCASLHVVQGTRVAPATLRALGDTVDLAVLGSSLVPYLSATLLASAPPAQAVSVFSEAYGVLQQLPGRDTLMGNALTVPGGEGLQLLSGAQPGASGSPVLDSRGLMLGVVVERVATAPGGASHTLSRGSGRRLVAGPTAVQAVPAARVRDFLNSHGIAFTQGDSAQIGPRQSPAARAATLSVGVICG